MPAQPHDAWAFAILVCELITYSTTVFSGEWFWWGPQLAIGAAVLLMYLLRPAWMLVGDGGELRTPRRLPGWPIAALPCAECATGLPDTCWSLLLWALVFVPATRSRDLHWALGLGVMPLLPVGRAYWALSATMPLPVGALFVFLLRDVARRRVGLRRRLRLVPTLGVAALIGGLVAGAAALAGVAFDGYDYPTFAARFWSEAVGCSLRALYFACIVDALWRLVGVWRMRRALAREVAS